MFALRRTGESLLLNVSGILEFLLGAIVASLAFVPVWLMVTSVRSLERQWSVTARLVERHQFVTSGPYGIWGYPIYAGPGGLLVATGLAFSLPGALIAAMALYAAGT